MPNNYLTRVEPGTYRFAVLPMNTDYTEPWLDPTAQWSYPNLFQWWSEEFTVEHTLGLPPPEPEPSPSPDPIPEPDPEPTPGPDVIVVVADYSNAPNLVSLIHATNYSNDLDAPVLRLYQAYFNPPPDLLGIKYWLDVRRSGYDQYAIAGFMAGSREFANNYEGVSDSEYLTRVYRNMLGRGRFHRSGSARVHLLRRVRPRQPMRLD